jgi:hypothetical protein
MNDWDTFTERVPWFQRDTGVANVLGTRQKYALSSQAAVLFPQLCELLANAHEIRGPATFRQWVNMVARQWFGHLSKSG